MNVSELVSDCEQCCGLCCVAPPFSASEDFAVDKEAGERCPNLSKDFRCSIHPRLKAEGFRGCSAYECYGAGQKVTQYTFRGENWRDKPEIAATMFNVFMRMRVVHECLMYLTEALKLELTQDLVHSIREKIDQLESVSLQDPDAICALDVSQQKREVDELIEQVGDLIRNASKQIK